MKDSDFYWLVGLLEGEGTFVKGPPSDPNKIAIRLQMTDEDVVSRAAKLLDASYQRYVPSNLRFKNTFCVSVTGYPALHVMKQLRPFMGIRRQEQIDSVIASWHPRPRRISRDQGEEIVHLFRSKQRSAVSLAEEYGVTKWAIYAIHQGRYFSDKKLSPHNPNGLRLGRERIKNKGL
jgi:hypothetical protein